MSKQTSPLRRAIPVLPAFALAPAALLVPTLSFAQSPPDSPENRIHESLGGVDDTNAAAPPIPTDSSQAAGEGLEPEPPASASGTEPAEEPEAASTSLIAFDRAAWDELVSLARQFCSAAVNCEQYYGAFGDMEYCASAQVAAHAYSMGVNSECDAAIMAEARFIAQNFNCPEGQDYAGMDAFYVQADRLADAAYRSCYAVYNPFPGPLGPELYASAQAVCDTLEACAPDGFDDLVPEVYTCPQALLYAADAGAFMLQGALDDQCASTIRTQMRCIRTAVDCTSLPYSLYELAYDCADYDVLLEACEPEYR